MDPSIVRLERHCGIGQFLCARDIARGVFAPVIVCARIQSNCKGGQRGHILWVKGKRPLEQLDRVVPGGLIKTVRQQNGFALRRQIDRIRIFGSFADRPKAFCLDEFLAKRMGETGDHFELQLTEVASFALETVGPNMGPRLGRDELCVDFNRLARATHAAFEQIADAEFAADLFRIDGFALLSERRISGDDKAVGYA